MSHRLCIASVITDLGYGGGESRLLSFSRSVDRSRFRHFVVTLYSHAPAYAQRCGSVREEYQASGVEVVDLGEPPLRRLLGSSHPRGLARSAADISRILGKLCRVLREREVDVIDAQHVTASFFGVLAGRLLHRPTTLTEYHVGFWERPGLRLPGKMLLGMSDALICDSRRKLEEINRWLLRPHPRGRVIANGIPVPVSVRSPSEMRRLLGLPEDPRVRVVGQVSRLVPYKGHRVLLQAASRVLEQERDVCFLLTGYAGDNPAYKAALEQEAAGLGIQDRVRIMGYPGPIGDVWACIDIHAHASLFDSAPIAITEGMAMGRPAVVTSVGGIPELVEHDETGLVVPPGNPTALSAALLRLLREPATAARLGAAARQRYAARHRPEHLARALENLFLELAR